MISISYGVDGPNCWTIRWGQRLWKQIFLKDTKLPSLDENHLYGTRVPSLYVYINISIQLRHRRNDIFNKVLCSAINNFYICVNSQVQSQRDKQTSFHSSLVCTLPELIASGNIQPHDELLPPVSSSSSLTAWSGIFYLCCRRMAVANNNCILLTAINSKTFTSP